MRNLEVRKHLLGNNWCLHGRDSHVSTLTKVVETRRSRHPEIVQSEAASSRPAEKLTGTGRL